MTARGASRSAARVPGASPGRLSRYERGRAKSPGFSCPIPGVSYARYAGEDSGEKSKLGG